ncbi:MAG: IS21 family transposase [Fastidiosipilaceae bacterium]
MHYPIKFDTSVEVKTLTDLPRLKIILEAANLKPNMSKIARDMSCDRRTAKRYYEGNFPSGTRDKPSYLDRHYDTIRDLLGPDSIQVFYFKSSLWRYLKREKILDCPESTFRGYITSRPELQAYFDRQKGPLPAGPKGTVRFETAPGEQAQIDWKEDISYRTKDGEQIKVNVLSMVLSYSRFRLFVLTTSRIQSILISAMTEFFETIGGVPHEILSDNLRSVMDEARTEYQKGKVNERFAQFSRDMGFCVHACLANRPQTKGKVESTMKILDDIQCYQGQLDYRGLQGLVQKLNHETNMNIHQGTGQVPLALFQKEKESLLSLPSDRIMTLYKIAQDHIKVSKDGLVSYKGSKYSVPAAYIGQTLFYEVIEQHLHLYDNTQQIACHPISSKKLNYLPHHYQEHLGRTQPFVDDIAERSRENLKKLGDLYHANIGS